MGTSAPGEGEEPRPEEPPAARQARVDAASVLADRLDNNGFFTALFDFTFTRFTARRLAGPVYVVGLLLIALSAIYGIVTSLVTAIATQSFWGVLVFLFGLVITLVGALLAVLLLRVGIELVAAIIEIAENTRGPGGPRR